MLEVGIWTTEAGCEFLSVDVGDLSFSPLQEQEALLIGNGLLSLTQYYKSPFFKPKPSSQLVILS